MYIESVPNRNSPPAVLLRESYREGGKVRKRTLANLSSWPEQLVEHFRVLLRGGVAVENPGEALTVERSLPHGHVAAVLGGARGCGAEHWFAGAGRLRPMLLALLVSRVIEPASKLATHRMLREETAVNSLGRMLGLADARQDDVYLALDWLVDHQSAIERSLVHRHLKGATLVLYDLTSTWLTGRCCTLAKHGYSRDGKRDDPQIVFGLVCSPQGCPLAVEVFSGNTADPATVATQVKKLKDRFGIEHLTWVGDRGMLTSARIETDLKPNGMDWISSLRAPQIAQLAEDCGPFQPSLFDERNLIEVSSPAFPGERLVVCRNPALAEERARKREELLVATEAELLRIVQATQRSRAPLTGAAKIALRVGAVIERFRMAKHFELTITDHSFAFARKTEAIAAEALLDGLYAIRTNLPPAALSSAQAVTAYKSLSAVERAFRCMKTIDLEVRPIFHWNADRVRAHVFLCMLAYYVEWHMRERLKPMLFDDEFIEEASTLRASPVARAERSDAARLKDKTKHTDDGLPVHSLRTLLKDLATLTLNIAHPAPNPNAKIVVTTRPTAVQDKAFRLLGIRPDCTQ